MQKTKLIEILTTFSREEFKEFEKFVDSPFFSRGRDLMPLFKLLKLQYPDFNNPNFTNESIYKKLHPSVKYEKNKAENILRVLTSEMVKVADEFLAYQKFNANKCQKAVYTLESYRERKINNLYPKLFKTTLDNIKQQDENIGADYFITLYHLYKDKNSFEFENDLLEEPQSERQLSLLAYFLYESSNVVAEARGRNLDFNIEMEDKFMELFFNSFDHEKFLSSLDSSSIEIDKKTGTFIELFLLRILILKNPGDKHLKLKFDELFYENKKWFDTVSKFNCYSLLHSYIDFQPVPDEQKLYILYKDMLKDNLYGPERDIPYLVYRSIMQNFASNKKLIETEEFINEYSQYLKPEIRDSMVNFSRASLAYFKGNFETALEYASKIELKHFILKYDTRNLLLYVHYELNNYEEALSLIESYKKFLKSNKNVSQPFFKSINTFLKYFKRIFEAKLSNDKSQLERLTVDMENEKEFWYKPKMLGMVNGLLSKA